MTLFANISAEWKENIFQHFMFHSIFAWRLWKKKLWDIWLLLSLAESKMKISFRKCLFTLLFFFFYLIYFRFIFGSVIN